MTTPQDIECEIRAFVTDDQYGGLLERLRREAAHEGRDEQVTYYFEGNGDPDLRIQRNARGGKIWYKGGKMHEDARREIEIPFETEGAFGKFEELFLALGYRVSIKWFRARETFKLGGVTVTLDDTKGYGKIVEFERLCAEDGREAALAGLKEAMAGYGIAPTPKEEFDRRYAAYKADWRSLLGEA
ncbi:MAG TPA: CYTH domain-containing protein [Patescibacteria group bacterium]|nr:CYTH domain-containing protein [Patescibacteria group bacterium]